MNQRSKHPLKHPPVDAFSFSREMGKEPDLPLKWAVEYATAFSAHDGRPIGWEVCQKGLTLQEAERVEKATLKDLGTARMVAYRWEYAPTGDDREEGEWEITIPLSFRKDWRQ